MNKHMHDFLVLLIVQMYECSRKESAGTMLGLWLALRCAHEAVEGKDKTEALQVTADMHLELLKWAEYHVDGSVAELFVGHLISQVELTGVR